VHYGWLEIGMRQKRIKFFTIAILFISISFSVKAGNLPGYCSENMTSCPSYNSSTINKSKIDEIENIFTVARRADFERKLRNYFLSTLMERKAKVIANSLNFNGQKVQLRQSALPECLKSDKEASRLNDQLENAVLKHRKSQGDEKETRAAEFLDQTLRAIKQYSAFQKQKRELDIQLDLVKEKKSQIATMKRSKLVAYRGGNYRDYRGAIAKLEKEIESIIKNNINQTRNSLNKKLVTLNNTMIFQHTSPQEGYIKLTEVAQNALRLMKNQERFSQVEEENKENSTIIEDKNSGWYESTKARVRSAGGYIKGGASWGKDLIRCDFSEQFNNPGCFPLKTAGAVTNLSHEQSIAILADGLSKDRRLKNDIVVGIDKREKEIITKINEGLEAACNMKGFNRDTLYQSPLIVKGFLIDQAQKGKADEKSIEGYKIVHCSILRSNESTHSTRSADLVAATVGFAVAAVVTGLTGGMAGPIMFGGMASLIGISDAGMNVYDSHKQMVISDSFTTSAVNNPNRLQLIEDYRSKLSARKTNIVTGLLSVSPLGFGAAMKVSKGVGAVKAARRARVAPSVNSNHVVSNSRGTANPANFVAKQGIAKRASTAIQKWRKTAKQISDSNELERRYRNNPSAVRKALKASGYVIGGIFVREQGKRYVLGMISDNENTVYDGRIAVARQVLAFIFKKNKDEGSEKPVEVMMPDGQVIYARSIDDLEYLDDKNTESS
jgi:hypothetical protein